MHEVRKRILGTVALVLTSLACHADGPGADARAQLVADLRDSLGGSSNPGVGFIDNGGHLTTHLYATFDTSLTANLSDSEFGLRARDLARFVVRHYAKSGELDSISVAVREPMRPGLWRVHHARTFAIADLTTLEAR